MTLQESSGSIHPNLKIGTESMPLRAEKPTAPLLQGEVKLVGDGFLVDRGTGNLLSLGTVAGFEQRPVLRHCSDLTRHRPRDLPTRLPFAVDELRPVSRPPTAGSQARDHPSGAMVAPGKPNAGYAVCSGVRVATFHLRAIGRDGKHGRPLVRIQRGSRCFAVRWCRGRTDDTRIVLSAYPAPSHRMGSRNWRELWRTGPVCNNTRCFKLPFPSDDTGLTPVLAARIRALARADRRAPQRRKAGAHECHADRPVQRAGQTARRGR